MTVNADTIAHKIRKNRQSPVASFSPHSMSPLLWAEWSYDPEIHFVNACGSWMDLLHRFVKIFRRGGNDQPPALVVLHVHIPFRVDDLRSAHLGFPRAGTCHCKEHGEENTFNNHGQEQARTMPMTPKRG